MQPTVETLPLFKQLASAVGKPAWPPLFNIVWGAPVLFYLPPDKSDLPDLITGVTALTFMTATMLIAAGVPGGRRA
jgi:hypothetical protein